MIVVLGGGLAGLSAAHTLSRDRLPVCLVEKDSRVGGLSQTLEFRGHRFDLGGHRFISDNPAIIALLEDLLGDDLLEIDRRSSIHMQGRFVDYPLRPANALSGLGLPTVGRILRDYGAERVRGLFRKIPAVTLEDWVVREFGRTIHEIYFRDYSEKVWGVDCTAIDAEWVEQRIEGLSLWKALSSALMKSRRKGIKTLADRFLYPRHGIGQLADALLREIRGRDGDAVRTGTAVAGIFHEGNRITGVKLADGGGTQRVSGDEYLSSIPLTVLLERLDPAPPPSVVAAAGRIAYRALVTATLIVDREQVTDQTWIYFPERRVPFGRIHEPRNWSPAMAPPGRTHLVVEYFCHRGDAIWNAPDGLIARRTEEELARLGLVRRGDVSGCRITRVPHAYPVFSVGYRKDLSHVTAYLDRFRNLACIGRTGMFRYLNMDRAMESGMEAAQAVTRRIAAARQAPARGPALFP